MASSDLPTALKASILDRLIDSESDGTVERPGYSVEQMIDSVRRDLEDLLNTHRTASLPRGKFPELENSILLYGMPDLSSFQSTKSEVRRRVIERIEQTISRFEPRLKDVRASLIEDTDDQQARLKFEIHATMRMDPSPEVSFVTILKLSTGETSIQRVDS